MIATPTANPASTIITPATTGPPKRAAMAANEPARGIDGWVSSTLRTR